jgi:quercetin dioxygenase-like cupin family protein
VRVIHTAALAFADLPGRRSADPFGGDGGAPVSVRLVHVEPGPRTMHRHPHSVEVIYVLEGQGVHRQGDDERPVRAGDLVLVDTGVAHCTTAVPGEPLRLLCFFPHPDLAQNTEETTCSTSS